MRKSSNEAEAIINEFGGLTKMARALGHKYVTTVQGWRDSGRIPPWRRLEIAAAAAREGVKLPPGFSERGETVSRVA